MFSQIIEVIVIFTIYGQSGAPRILDFKCIAHILLTTVFYLTKAEKKTKKTLTEPSNRCF